MALLIDLKPNEKLLVGNTLITNDKQKTRLRIEGSAPILREKDTMHEKDANTHAKKLYLIIQNIYLAPETKAIDEFGFYFKQLKSIVQVAPHVENYLNLVSSHIVQGTYYKAMKLVQELMNCEESGDAPNTPNAKTPSPKDQMEAQLLNQAADQLEELQSNFGSLSSEEIAPAVSYNRKLWMAFMDGISDNGDSNKSAPENFDILNNILNLYQFIYNASTTVTKDKDSDKLQTLIDINRATATSLLNY